MKNYGCFSQLATSSFRDWIVATNPVWLQRQTNRMKHGGLGAAAGQCGINPQWYIDSSVCEPDCTVIAGNPDCGCNSCQIATGDRIFSGVLAEQATVMLTCSSNLFGGLPSGVTPTQINGSIASGAFQNGFSTNMYIYEVTLPAGDYTGTSSITCHGSFGGTIDSSFGSFILRGSWMRPSAISPAAACATSSGYDTSCVNTFDGVDSTWYHTSGNPPLGVSTRPTLTYDFGGVVEISGFRQYAYRTQFSAGECLRDFNLYTCTDSSCADRTSIGSFTHAGTSQTFAGDQTSTFASVSTRYLMVELTGNHGDHHWGGRANIAEVEFLSTGTTR